MFTYDPSKTESKACGTLYSSMYTSMMRSFFHADACHGGWMWRVVWIHTYTTLLRGGGNAADACHGTCGVWCVVWCMLKVYTTTVQATMGDMGSVVLKPVPLNLQSNWTAGTSVDVAWGVFVLA